MFSWVNVCRSLTYSKFIVQMKYYGRWSHRRPIRILPSEEEQQIIETTVDTNLEDRIKLEKNNIANIRWRHIPPSESESNTGQTNIVRKSHVKRNIAKTSYDMLQTVIGSGGEFIYTKLPDKDAKLTSILTSVQSNNAKEKKSILLEGKRLIKEALENNCKLEYLLFSRKSDVEELKVFLPKSGATLYKVPYKEIQLWSNLITSPGVMGIFRKPDTEKFEPASDTIPLTVICDNIREPGNLGAVLRTCAGAGCQNVILTKGCVNLWDTKVTRSSCGAHFHLRIYTKIDWSEMKEHIQSNSMLFMADNKLLTSLPKNLEDNAFRMQNIPLVPYYGIHIDKNQSNILIIGGETEGLSEDAYKFVFGHKGIRLNIPLTSGVDSLNSGVALGIILFEMKKQMLLNAEQKEYQIQNVG